MEDRSTLRRHIEAQGYLGLDDETLVGLDPWLKLTPFLTCLVAGLGTLVESSALLAALSLVTFLGVLLPRHPVDSLYNGLIRNLEDSPPIPLTPRRRRLVYLIWSGTLAASAYCFATGNVKIGFLTGWFVAAIVGFLAAQQICLISEAIQRVAGSRSRERA